MYLRFHLDENGKRVYTFKFHDEKNEPTLSAHPGKLFIYANTITARFSPDDVYQKERMKCKERFNLLPT
jgi:H/ACA ribonucleoprotein complex subunit 3